jgi:hypothetical protein
MTVQTSRPTLRTAASPVPSDRGAPAGILARLEPDDLHPARLAGPPTRPRRPSPRAPSPLSERTGRRPARPAGRSARPTDLAAPTGPHFRRDRLVLHVRAATGWQATIRVDPALEIGGARGRGVVVDREGWPILNELDALNDRCNHIDPDRPTSQDLADLANSVRTAAARPADTRRVTTPLDRLLHLQATATPRTASRLATIVTT